MSIDRDILLGAHVYSLITRLRGKGKIKVKLSLCIFNRGLRHEGVLGEWRYSSTHSMISALDAGG
jgi:hypothetical protein